jgi:hypothetical protein
MNSELLNKNKNLKKWAVYTVVFDDYDIVLPPCFALKKHADFYLFTDNPNKKVFDWETIVVKKDPKINYSLNNRKLKIVPPDLICQYAYSMYVDGNIFLKGNLSEIFEKFENVFADIGTFVHPERGTVSEELHACVERGKSTQEKICAEKTFLETEGFDLANSSLTANWIILRRNTSTALKQAMIDWWNVVKEYSGRDQVSLPFIKEKHDLSAFVFQINILQKNKYFARLPHAKHVTTAIYLSRFVFFRIACIVNRLLRIRATLHL